MHGFTQSRRRSSVSANATSLEPDYSLDRARLPSSIKGEDCLAAPQGFEPRYADPESAVLPLNEGATSARCGSSCSRLAGAPERDAQSQPLHVTGISPSGQFQRSGQSEHQNPPNSIPVQFSISSLPRATPRAALRAAAVRECGSLQSSPSPLPAKPFPKAQSPLRPTRC